MTTDQMPHTPTVSLDDQIALFRARADFAEAMGNPEAAEVNNQVARMLVRLGDDIAWEERDATDNPERRDEWRKVIHHFAIRV